MKWWGWGVAAKLIRWRDQLSTMYSSNMRWVKMDEMDGWVDKMDCGWIQTSWLRLMCGWSWDDVLKHDGGLDEMDGLVARFWWMHGLDWIAGLTQMDLNIFSSNLQFQRGYPSKKGTSFKKFIFLSWNHIIRILTISMRIIDQFWCLHIFMLGATSPFCFTKSKEKVEHFVTLWSAWPRQF